MVIVCFLKFVICDLLSLGMILGIDPGLANTGWAVIDEGKLIDYGCIETKLDSNLTARLGKIYTQILGLVKKYEVKEMAVENLFFAKNVKSAISVAQAIGAIKIAGFENGINVVEYTPLQVKSNLVGYGKAEKYQVEMMVRNILGLEKSIKPSHAADAVAVALTHCGIMKI